MIPYGRQDVSEEDVRAVVEVLRSSHLTQGPAIELFEARVAEVTGARHAVALANGTAGLHLACLGLGLGPGKRLWTVPNTFVASANCALYCGAEVDFVDVDARTFDLDPGALAAKLERAARAGALPDVVVPVHFGGRPARMAALAALAEEHGFALLEDATHAIGARDESGPIGACTRSAAAVFSFHPVKIITTGEGGVVTTNDAELAARLRRLRTHGVTRDPAEMERAPEGQWAYDLVELGYNYRLTDLQAALGTSQLARLEDFVERRRELAARYDRLLADLPLERPAPLAPHARSAWHLYVVLVPEAAERAAVFGAMREAGIGVNVHYTPVHLQPLYRRRGFAPGDFPVAEAYAERALTLPLYPGLREDEQDFVVDTLRRLVG